MNAAAAIIRRRPGPPWRFERFGRIPLPVSEDDIAGGSPSSAPVDVVGRDAESTDASVRRSNLGRHQRLDIEHPFGMILVAIAPWESRVTRHDADRKLKILHYIAGTLRARGFPPSVREIAVAVGLSSTSAVHHHLQMLEREGYLERGAAQSRAIRLTPTAAIQLGLTHELVPQSITAEAHVLPVIGEIAAGGPIEAYQDASETMAIPDLLAPSGDAYVLRVRGDSMIEEHIADGDFVLIRPQTTARNGDIVVAQVEENAVTLKRFFREKDRVRLQPANPAYQPQFYDDVRIQGKLIGVIRKLD
jgi:repressor LexA